MERRAAGIVLALAVAGCGATPLYDVRFDDNHGVPFYLQEQFDVRTYAYEEVLYELKATGTFKPDVDQFEDAKKKGRLGVGSDAAPKKVERKDDGKPAKKEQDDNAIIRTVVVFARNFSIAAPYYMSFLQDTDNVQAWKDTGASLLDDVADPAKADSLRLVPFPPRSLSAIATPPGDPDVRLVAVDRTRIQIPSTTKEYLNLNVPHGGSANGEVDLNADGTLGKGVAQKQDQLPAAIASAVGTVGAAVLGTPLNTIVAHYFAPAATAHAANGEKVIKIDFSITPIKRTYVVKVTKSVNLTIAPGGADPCGPRAWDALLATFDPQAKCRVELSMSVQRGDDKPKDDTPKNAITISGATGAADAGASP